MQNCGSSKHLGGSCSACDICNSSLHTAAELVLDTAAARAGIYPPVNLLLSGTKRAELIASKEQLDGIKLIHEMLGSLRAVDMIPQLLSMLEKTTNNEDLLVRIKDWAALMKQ